MDELVDVMSIQKSNIDGLVHYVGIIEDITLMKPHNQHNWCNINVSPTVNCTKCI